MGYDFGVNQALVEELFLRYRENPAAVPEAWRKYFDAQPLAETRAAPTSRESAPPERSLESVIVAPAPPSERVARTRTDSGVFTLPATSELGAPPAFRGSIPPTPE